MDVAARHTERCRNRVTGPRRFQVKTMRIVRRGAPALLLLLAGLLGGPALTAAQTATQEKLPGRTDKLLIVLSPKDATAKVFLANADRLDLLRTIPTGKGPQDVCIAPDGNTAYVANGLDDSITVIDLEHLKAAGTLAPAKLKSPTSVAITPDGKKLYVGARGSNLLLVLSPAGQVLKEIALTDPATVAIAPAARRAYVASNSTQSVLVVDTVTDEIVATIKTGRQPRGIAFTPDGKTVVITCVAHDVMHLVDAATNEVKATIGAGRSLQSAAVLPDGGWPSPSRAMCAMQASIPTCRWLTCAAPARAKSRTFPLARWPIRSWSAVTALICM